MENFVLIRVQVQPASREGSGGRGRGTGEHGREESPWENLIHIIGRPSLQALWTLRVVAKLVCTLELSTAFQKRYFSDEIRAFVSI